MKQTMIIQVLLWLAYPVIIFFGLEYVEPRIIALALGLLLIVRWRKKTLDVFQGMTWLPVTVSSILLTAVLLISITNNESWVRLYPVLVSLGMLVTFAYTLLRPPSMIERLAMLHRKSMDASGVAYTRTVTIVWCVFFIINGSIALYTAFYASREIWAWYNGFITYLIMGVLYAAEWLVRQQVVEKNKNNQ